MANNVDIEQISMLYEEAKEDMLKQKIYQWTSDYPNIVDIRNDISKRILYKLQNENFRILAIVTIDKKNDHTFYIKRIVVSKAERRNGTVDYLINMIEKKIHDMGGKRIVSSTNHTNYRMINLLRKYSYSKCGEFIVTDRSSFGPFYEFEKYIDLKK